ncbi:MAG TPA: methyltransferase domain-containing protein [Polyangia bacterium]|jgi:SAM-dependent methyltransferase
MRAQVWWGRGPKTAPRRPSLRTVTTADAENKRRVEAFFDDSEYWQADIYEEARDRFARAVARRKDYAFEMLARLPDVRRGRALDIGCGGGFYLEELARRGFAAAGVDSSPGMLDRCRDRLARAGLGARVRLAHGDVEALPFDDGSFDLVLAIGVLGYLLRDDRALAELRRVLRPGGYVIVNVTNQWSLAELLSTARIKLGRVLSGQPHEDGPGTLTSRWIRDHSPTGLHYKYYDLRAFERRMQRQGLQLVDAMTLSFPLRTLRRAGVPEAVTVGLEVALERILQRVRVPYLAYAGESYTGVFR